MVVTVSLGFKDVLIDGQTIPVIKITKLIDEQIHHLIIIELLVVNKFCFFLDDIVETKSIRKLELLVDLWCHSFRLL